MESLRQEYCSGLSLPSPGDLPHLGVEPTSLPCREEECLNSLSLNHFVLAAKKAGRGRRLKGLLVARFYHWWDITNPLFTPNSCFLAAWDSTHTLTCTHAYAHAHIHRLSHICVHLFTPHLYTPTPPHAHIQMCTHLHTQVHAHTHTHRGTCVPRCTHTFFKKTSHLSDRQSPFRGSEVKSLGKTRFNLSPHWPCLPLPPPTNKRASAL